MILSILIFNRVLSRQLNRMYYALLSNDAELVSLCRVIKLTDSLPKLSSSHREAGLGSLGVYFVSIR